MEWCLLKIDTSEKKVILYPKDIFFLSIHLFIYLFLKW